MSMLAERKRKQKWSLNPRGKEWSEDSNKFGQKMLEKMGWSKGKGLGANENGMTEHVKLSYKNDSKGMGYKETSDQWTEHEQNFSKLLQSLGGSEKIDTQVKSLEKKSQHSRVRVHYHKFTRGKDLSRYSEKDLANIFGKKSLTDPEVQVEETDATEEKVTIENRNDFLVNSGSMMDYFKKKLPSFGKNNVGFVIGNNGVLKVEEEVVSEDDTGHSGFGFKNEEKTSNFVSYVKPKEEVQEKQKNKRKTTKEIDVFSPNKKKKKESLGLSNPAFDPMHTPIKFEKHSLEMIEESINEESSLEESNIETIEVSVQIHNEETPEKKKKKRKKGGIQNRLFIEESRNVDVIENFEENAYEVKIKKKRKKTVDENEEKDSIQIEENPYEIKPKKKKTKMKEMELGIENQLFIEESRNVDLIENFEENAYELKIEKERKKTVEENEEKDSIQIEENPYEIKPKKKKRKMKEMELGIENHIYDENDNGKSEFKEEFEVKRKEKKKKKKMEGLNNLALNLDDEEGGKDFDLMLNIVTTPAAEKNVKARKSVRFSDVNEERIIPNIREMEDEEVITFKKVKKNKKGMNGLKNPAFDERATEMQENCQEIMKKFDSYQAEVENDLNEQKLRTVTVDDIMVGEVGNPEGDSERLPCGAVKLKFKHAKFGRTPGYLASLTGAKKSYKHLIKGDIIVDFNGSNLHEIDGYAGRKENY